MAGLTNESRVAEAAGAGGPRPHFAPRAKRVIFLFMQGGPSHVDSFDYKPQLAEHNGEAFEFADDRVKAKTGMRTSTHKLMQSPWTFRQYGQTGHWVSDLFPETAQHVDRLCFVHSLHTEGVAHGPATLFLHCGATNFIRPSIGSWITYGLGTENQNLPGFVTIAPSAGNGGPRNYGSAFLPPDHQGMPIGSVGASDLRVSDLENGRFPRAEQFRQLQLTQSLNRHQLARAGGGSELEAVINSFELAWRMQNNAPNLLDLAGESPRTLAEYGIGEPETDAFGRECLLARRLCEAGVRYIQVNYGDNSANPAWDQHSNLPRHAEHARRVDRPIAALLADLQQRGLLEDTIVWWGASSVVPLTRRTTARGVITTPADSRCGSLAAASNRDSGTDEPIPSDIRQSKTRFTCTICTPPSCICWGSTTSS